MLYLPRFSETVVRFMLLACFILQPAGKLAASERVAKQHLAGGVPFSLTPEELRHPVVKWIDRVLADPRERLRVISAICRGRLQQLGPEYKFFARDSRFSRMLEEILTMDASKSAKLSFRSIQGIVEDQNNEALQIIAAQPEGPAHGMAFYKNFIFLGAGAAIVALDTSTDPAMKVGVQPVPFAIKDLALSGDSLYVLGERMIHVYDLSVMGKRAREGGLLPFPLVGSHRLDFSATDLLTKGFLVFITSTQGVHIFQVNSNGGFDNLGMAAAPFAFAAETIPQTTWLIVATWTGLKVFDILNPSMPQLLGSYTTNESIFGLSAAGHYAFLLMGPGINILDITNPDQIQDVTTIPGTFTDLKAFECNGTVTLFASQRWTLLGYNSSDWTTAFLSFFLNWAWDRIILEFNPCGLPTRVGGYGRDGVQWNSYDGTTMTYKGDYDTYDPILDTAVPVVWTVTFPLEHVYGMSPRRIYEVSWPSNSERPSVLSTSFNGLGDQLGFTGDMTAWESQSGRYAAVGLDFAEGATIQDVTDIENPYELARAQVNGFANALVDCGDYLFVGNDKGEVIVFDKSNPNNLVRVGSIQIPNGDISKLQADCPNRLYVAARDGGFVILDISDKTNPKILGQVEGSVSMFGVMGNTACVYDWTAGGIRVMDIQDPTNPKQTDFLPGDDIGDGALVLDVAAADGYLHVQTRVEHYEIYRVENGKIIRRVADTQVPGGAKIEIHKSTGGLSKQGAENPYLILVASLDAGMYVLRFDPTALNTAPEFISALGDTTVRVGETLVYNFDATDADGDSVWFVTLSLPEGATLDGASGLFQWQVTAQVATGNYLVTVGATDGRDTTAVSATVTVVPATGIQDDIVPSSFHIEAMYPNPFLDRLYLQYSTPISGELSVTLYDVLGRKVKTFEPVSVGQGASRQMRFEIHSLPAGVYLVRIEAEFAGRNMRISRKMLHLR